MEAVSARITSEPGKPGERPCIRGLQIKVWDLLGWLSAGMSEKEILDEHPDLEKADFQAVYQYAAENGHETNPGPSGRADAPNHANYDEACRGF
jgi:uncharacterized protein (DUF433 family)